MKRSTLRLRNRFNNKRNTRRFKNWKSIQRMVFQCNRCAYCRKLLRGEVHVDHVRPLSHSTSDRINNYSNLVVACKNCNKIKGCTVGVEYPEWVARRKSKFRQADYKYLLKLAEEMKR